MKSIFSGSKHHEERCRELDYAKTIAIIFMIIIHAWEELSIYNVVANPPEGLWENLLQFVAGPLTAPVFMFCLGVGIIYTRHGSPKELAQRGLLILAAAYLLNLGRKGIWKYLIYRPDDIWDNGAVVYSLLNGDILHFAGLTFLLAALLRALNIPILLQGAIAIIMLQFSSILIDEYPIQGYPKYFFGLFYFMSVCSFPLLQWFVYPAFGMIFGRYLQDSDNRGTMYGLLLVISAAALYGLHTITASEGFYFHYIYLLQYDTYYNQELFHFLYTILIILIELSLLYFLTKSLDGKLEFFVLFTARNVTGIYIIQWLLVGGIYYYQYITDHPGFSGEVSTAVGLLLFAVSLLLVKLKNNLAETSAH